MDTDRLASLIAQKHGLLMQIHELSQRQPDILGTGDTGKLLSLLAAKQGLLQQLQGLERQLDPFRHQDPERRSWRSPRQRQDTQALAARCESLLTEIMRVEKECEHELVARRDAAANRLQGAYSSAHATHAYTHTATSPSQLDVSSET